MQAARAGGLARLFEPGQGQPDRLLPMEGLRGVAVILVFFVHYGALLRMATGGAPPAPGRALEAFGHVGVDLFFALSGLLIHGAMLRRPRPYGAFLARRIQRLYPAFLVVFALHLAAALLSHTRAGLPPPGWDMAPFLLANLLFLPGIFDIRAVVVVAWSLSYEMAFYLTLPPLLAVLRWRRWPLAWRLAVLVAAVLAVGALGWQHARFAMFGCGMLLAELLPVLAPRLRAAGWLDALAIGAAAALLLGQPAAGPLLPCLFGTGFLVCLAAFGRSGPVARALSLRPLRWLGNMSYAYYLAHGFALMVFFVLLQAPLAGQPAGPLWWLLLAPAFATTLAGGAALYLLVERPFSILPAERPVRALRAAA